MTDPFQATACFMRLSGYLLETQVRTGTALMGVAMRAGAGSATVSAERAKSCSRPVAITPKVAPPRSVRPRSLAELPHPSATLVEMTG
ncbi:hypothetical protein [Mesobacterium pallidum]|uniref:hypothetical protein n=1 Tax=Mesobacterium pallidum TaxID=2872037 RepID=UPI001EE2271C|nr:hypothetical protein [Mesobacterium pallidum]